MADDSENIKLPYMGNLKNELKELVNHILKKGESNISDYKIMGEAQRNTSCDIDIVLILKDQCDTYTLVKNVTPLLAAFIKNHGLFISCFPIKEMIYNSDNTESQYLKNVKLNGWKFEIE